MAENILKIKNDYFDISNISYLDDYVFVVLHNFDYRPNMPLNLTNPKFFNFEKNILKINHEDTNDLFNKNYLELNYDVSTDGFVKQFFFNFAIKLPYMYKPIKYSSDKYLIINSYNFMEIYDKIFELFEIDKNKFVIVYTKKFYTTIKNTMIKKYEENNYYFNSNYFIIPHINIYYNYEKVDNKYLCELSGTIIN